MKKYFINNQNNKSYRLEELTDKEIKGSTKIREENQSEWINAYTIEELKDLIDSEKVKVIIIPDIESVNYGRGVGYDIIEHVPPKDIGEISATKIRASLNLEK